MITIRDLLRTAPLLLGPVLQTLGAAMPCRVAMLPQVIRAAENDFVLIRRGIPASVCVDGQANPAVKRVAGALAEDLSRIAGVAAAPVKEVDGAGDNTIVIGVLGETPAIDGLVRAGRLHIGGIAGRWESAVVETVANPWPGTRKALVVAGSDRRGAIYGAYWISASLGVSPWSWWADVPVAHRDFAAFAGGAYELPSPKVKYRGIFLNDEDWTLRPWAAQTNDPTTGNIGPKTYARVFELLLRLRGNLLWPAMHPGTRDFNFYPENKVLADEYGVVIGSSHAEPMLRDNVDEWERDGHGEYNYVTNREGVLKYWEDRVRTNGGFENIYTVGMRGIHDGEMAGGGSISDRAARLRQVISDQRDLLRKHEAPEVAKIPQMFCAYKELLPVYQAQPSVVPADVTLVWPDDNFGYIQHLSTAEEQARPGGAGVYYHISYWGRPYDHLWLPSTPPALIGQEMTKAWRHGASRIWVVNVGGLKPREWEMEFFLRLAWDPETWQPSGGQDDFLRSVAARDLGEKHAAEIAGILNEYYRLCMQRRPEHVGLDAGSPWLRQPLFVADSDEARKRAATFIVLRRQVDAIGAQMDGMHRAAFFELLGYPVHGAALMNLKWLSFERGQAEPAGSSAAERCYAAAAGAQKRIDQLVQTYDNLVDGKWRHMATSRPREQSVFDLPLPSSMRSAPTLDPEVVWADSSPAPSDSPAEKPSTVPERDGIIRIVASEAGHLTRGGRSEWVKVRGLGYHGTALTTRISSQNEANAAPAQSEYSFKVATAGQWQIRIRVLPTWPPAAGRPDRITVSVDGGKPAVLVLPIYRDENDPQWQQDVLRNAAILTTSADLATGPHRLHIGAPDPDVLLDSILLVAPGASISSYAWSDRSATPSE